MTNGHTLAIELLLEPKGNIWNIVFDYQFVSSVLDELSVSRHA